MSFLDNIRQAPPKRQAATAAIVMIPAVALLLAIYLLVLRKPYEPLFTNLRPTDAATIVADLDKKKIAYRLADDGATILVPKDKVAATRLSVANEDLPLKGQVGFELFNKSDMGLTEFAQRINYQRALQGELARTIMSMEEIDTARVHLSIAEPTIFRDDRRPSKASVSLSLRPGKTLSPDAVAGVQRLVAAAVPELDAANVVVLDEQGRVVSGEPLSIQASVPEMAAVEQEYADRITRALEKFYPAGAVHVLVRAGQPAPAPEAAMSAGVAARTFPLSVVVNVSAPLAPQADGQVRAVIKEVLGGELAPGDAIEVSGAPAAASPVPPAAVPPPIARSWGPSFELGSPKGFWTLMLLPLSLLLGGAALILHRRQLSAPRRLSEQQREAYVRRLKAALDEGELNAFPPA